MTFVALTANEFGTRVAVYDCSTCGKRYTVCPAPEDNHSDWQNCLAPECASYDPARDADRFFDDGNVISLAGRRQPIIRRKI